MSVKKLLTLAAAIGLLSAGGAFAQAQVSTVGGQENSGGAFATYSDADGNPVVSADPATASDESGIENVVTATGTYAGVQYTNDAFENVDVEAADPKLSITKVADITTGAKAGDVITYTYTIENTGNVTLTNVGLVDDHKGTGTDFAFQDDCAITTGSLSAIAGGTITTFVPQEIVECTATYTVTQQDVDTLQ